MTGGEREHFLYHIRNRESSSGFGFDGYIGITNDLSRRKKQHFAALAKGNHKNERLQAAYDAAPGDVEFYVVASGTKDEMAARERLLVPRRNHHWNKQIGGGPNRGMTRGEAAASAHRGQRTQTDDSGGHAGERTSAKGEDVHRDRTRRSGGGQLKRAVGKGATAAPGIAMCADIAATGGMLAATVASGMGTAHAINKTLLKDDLSLETREREARRIGRIGAYGGAGLGATGTMFAIYTAGEVGLSAVGVGSGLTALGGVVGGAGIAGFALALAIPAAAAALGGGALYGGYKLCKRLFRKGWRGSSHPVGSV